MIVLKKEKQTKIYFLHFLMTEMSCLHWFLNVWNISFYFILFGRKIKETLRLTSGGNRHQNNKDTIYCISKTKLLFLNRDCEIKYKYTSDSFWNVSHNFTNAWKTAYVPHFEVKLACRMESFTNLQQFSLARRCQARQLQSSASTSKSYSALWPVLFKFTSPVHRDYREHMLWCPPLRLGWLWRRTVVLYL